MSQNGDVSWDPLRRTAAQIELIRGSFSEAGIPVGAAPPTPGDSGVARYLYGAGWVLVRDRDVPRVLEVLHGSRDRSQVDRDRDDNLINGVTRVRVPDGETLSALDVLDRRLGAGVATPDHVLSIAPASWCPGTEPLLPDDDPLPPRAEPGTDRVAVSVVDTGWIPGDDTEIDLTGVTGDVEDWYAAAQVAGGVTAQTPIPPYAGHGRFVTGVLRSLAPAADVYVHKVFNRAGAVLESDIVTALDAALDRSPDIISMSAGTNSRLNLDLLGFEAFYENRLRHYKGVTLVAAAGNNSERYPFWPAAFPWAVSCGALAAAQDAIAWFSNYGRWVDIYAPGEDVPGAFVTGTYTYTEPPLEGTVKQFAGRAKWSGTSFATPYVTARVVALMAELGCNAQEAARRLIQDARVVQGVGRVVL